MAITHATQTAESNDPAYDVSATAWEEAHAVTGGRITPLGAVIGWAGTIAAIPTGFLLCNGASLLRSGTYADLFAAIGTVHGAADGTHFNVPDLRDKFVVGATSDDAGVPKTNLTGSLAQSGGSVSHQHAAHSIGGVALSAHSGAAVSAHSLSTNVALSSHSGAAVSSHSGAAVSAHTLSTNVAIANHGTANARTSTANTVAVASVVSHTITQPVVAAHTVTQPSDHLVTQPSDHLITQPVVGAHTVTQPDAHTITQPTISAHDTLTAAQPYYALAYIICAVAG